MTASVARSLIHISDDIELTFYTAPLRAPPSINTMEDADLSTTAVLNGLGLISSKPFQRSPLPDPIEHYAAIIVGCYSPHPLVPALRTALRSHPTYPSVPVIAGIFESSLYAALQLGSTFGIVTTGTQWEDIMMKGIPEPGGVVGSRCVGVRGTGIGVLELESGGDGAKEMNCTDYADNVDRMYRILLGKALELIACGAEVILLGCAGMSLWRERIQTGVWDALQVQSRKLGQERAVYVPVVDGVKAAIEQAAAMCRMNKV
ncbi:hypothetical protein HK097_011115 [Rhizophlyctis rosea]|uniref:Hydantoin racemase n=1 Tax=Rhizophlyctis rosea TaxID=64517 RepID=A0AAD5SK22_9FUNG|nr:hypothetical protein HK097_011115 [Rhizophlyctis rosea]